MHYRPVTSLRIPTLVMPCFVCQDTGQDQFFLFVLVSLLFPYLVLVIIVIVTIFFPNFLLCLCYPSTLPHCHHMPISFLPTHVFFIHDSWIPRDSYYNHAQSSFTTHVYLVDSSMMTHYLHATHTYL